MCSYSMESRSSEIVALQEEIRRLRVTEAKCARAKDWDGAQKAEESCIAIEASVQTILRKEIDRLQEQEVECVKAKNWAHAKQITAELAALEALNGQVSQLSAAPRSGAAQSSAVTVVPVNNPEGMKSKISEPPRASIATPPSDALPPPASLPEPESPPNALPPPSSLPEPESPSVPEQDEHETERRRSEGMVDPEGPPPEVSLLEENHVSWQMQEIEKVRRARIYRASWLQLHTAEAAACISTCTAACPPYHSRCPHRCLLPHIDLSVESCAQKSWVKRRLHGMHSITSLLKRWAPVFEVGLSLRSP